MDPCMIAFMTNASVPVEPAAWHRLGMATGIAGVTTVVLLFVVLVGSRAEPALEAPAAEVLIHYRAPTTVGSPFRSFALTLAVISLVWFGVTLSVLLRRAEGEAPWRSSIAMVSAVLF